MSFRKIPYPVLQAFFLVSSGQYRIAALFHSVTSEVFFPVVYLSSCESHMSSFFLIIKGFVRSVMQLKTIVGSSISSVCRKEACPCLGMIPLYANSWFTSSPFLKDVVCAEFPV